MTVCIFQKKEDEMMVRLKSAEHAQVVAEMRQRIAELEIEVSMSLCHMESPD